MVNGKKNNVLFPLRNREVRCENSRRTDFRILKTLVAHSKREFKKVWSKQSTTAFRYEAGYLYMDNYRSCHSGYAVDGGFTEKYRLPKPDAYIKNKIEDAIIYKCYHENFHKCDSKGSLIGLRSRHNGESLVQYDLDTGLILREIFLTPYTRFKYISWVEINEMFVVKSKHIVQPRLNNMTQGSSVAGVMAVFSAFPLHFVGMFEVDRKVFGPGISDIMLTNSFLIVMFITDHVKFYSFPYILEKFKLPDMAVDCGESCNGAFNVGLPVNIKITECPPVLFEVKCADRDVQVGGFPWHYIITPHLASEVYSLHNGKQAKNGSLVHRYGNSEPDSCVFHDDLSGRIVHITSPDIRILHIKSEEGKENTELEPGNTISLKQTSQVTDRAFQVTSSGRVVKRKQSLEEVDNSEDITIHQFQYEDELDLSWLSATYHHPALRSVVHFYDNNTFDLLREVHLQDPWNGVNENIVHVDLDTIVHVFKPQCGHFQCTVYRLAGDPTLDPQEQGPKHKSHKSGKSSHRTTRSRMR